MLFQISIGMSYAVLCFVVKKKVNNDRHTHATLKQ